VVVAYHLDSLPSGLKLTGEVIAQIFMGQIKLWNDSKILELNPELKTELNQLPNKDILVVHRADGSGTTSIFSEYLAKSSAPWKEKVGKGNALRWPLGIGGKGNEGVSSFVKQIPGAIGYVELVFAKRLGLKMASLQNPLGEFVVPSSDSVTRAALGALSLIPEDFRTSITLVSAPGAYPVSSFTYMLLYDRMSGKKRKPLFDFVRWGLQTGQSFGVALNYAALPESLVTRILKRLDQSDDVQNKGEGK
jgi:phosphate transport system substrate-binding protein